MKRHGLVGGVGADAHLLDDGVEQRRHVVGGPAGQAPGVVVRAMAHGRDRAVVGGAAADHASALERPAPVAAGVAPVVRQREGGGINEVDGPARCAVRAIIRPGLHEDHIAAGFGEPRGRGGARRAATDDHEVGRCAHGARSSHWVVPHVIARNVQACPVAAPW